MKRVLLVVGLLGLIAPLPAVAQVLTLQAEYYTASHDIDYDVIQSLSGYLFGLDYGDEWTEYHLTVNSWGEYSVSMLVRGNLGAAYQLRLIFTADGSGNEQTINVPFTGSGWG